MEENEVVLEILEIIRDHSLSKIELKNKLKQYHESDIADAVPLLSEDEEKEFFNKLTVEELGELFIYLDSPEEYLEEMDIEKAADILETMDADDAIDVLENVDEEFAQDIIEEMEEESREDVELINTFDEDEIGSKITTNFITITKNMSIKEAMKTLVKEAPENDNIQNLFVVEDTGSYYGTVILKDLIIAREGSKLLDITKTQYPTLYSHEKVEDVINEIKDIDLDLIPVLNEDDDTILGVITQSDITETVGEELNEDYVKFAAVGEEADSSDNLFQAVRRRVPWLGLLLILDIFTSTVLSGFDAIYAILPFLVLFQSWILDSSGNAGTQSLALTIRSITEDKINKKTLGKYFLKELSTGLIDGLLVACAGFGISLIFLLISKTSSISSLSMSEKLITSSIVAFSLFCAIPFTSLAGLFIPLFFKKIHIDPAVASGPLITTLADMGGVAIYYSIAMLLMKFFTSVA